MTDRLRQRAERYGLPIATAAFGVAGTLLGLASVALGAMMAVSGMIAVAALDIAGRVHGAGEAEAAQTRALERLADAARMLRSTLANGMPLGGTTVPDGTVHERLAGMAEQLRGARFTFLPGRRWSDWYWLGNALTTGRLEILAAAGLTGGRLPGEEDARMRPFVDLLQAAAGHAFEISSYYAGYDVTEEPKRQRWEPEDRDVDVTSIAAYSAFATEFSEILAELQRLADRRPVGLASLG